MSGILPFLDRIKCEIKQLFPSKKEPIRVHSNVALINSNHAVRFVENLHSFQIIVDESFIKKEERFCFRSFFGKLENQMPYELMLIHSLEVQVVRESDDERIPQFCMGDERLLLRLIHNIVWGLVELRNPKVINVTLKYNSEREVFQVNIYAAAKKDDRSEEIEVEEKPMKEEQYMIGEKDAHLCFFTSSKLIAELGGNLLAYLAYTSGPSSVGMGFKTEIPLPIAKGDGPSLPQSFSPSVAYESQKFPPLRSTPNYFQRNYAQNDTNIIEEEQEESMLSVLILDDIVICRMIIRKFVEQFSSELGLKCSVCEGENGMIGYDLISSGKIVPDLIFTDYNMPGCDGDIFSRSVVKDNLIEKPWCDIYLVTGAALDNQSRFCEENHFTEIISKPVYKIFVREKIEACLRKRKAMKDCRLHKMKKIMERSRDSITGLGVDLDTIFNQSQETLPPKRRIREKSEVTEEKSIAKSPTQAKPNILNRTRQSLSRIMLGNLLGVLFTLGLAFFFNLDEYLWSVYFCFGYVMFGTIANVCLSFFIEDSILCGFLSDLIRRSGVILFIPPGRIFFNVGFSTLSSFYESYDESESNYGRKDDDLLRSQVKYSTLYLFYIVVVEIFTSLYLTQLHTYSDIRFHTICELLLLCLLVQSTYKMSIKKEEKQKELKESVIKFLEVDGQLKLMIKFCSNSFRSHLQYIDHFTESLYNEINTNPDCRRLFLTNEKEEDEDEDDINTYFRIVRNSITQFKKDQINLFLVHCMLDGERNVFIQKRKKGVRPCPIRLCSFIRSIFREQDVIVDGTNGKSEKFNVRMEYFDRSKNHQENNLDRIEEDFFEVDPYSLYIVMVNMIQNAVDNTCKGKMIDIDVSVRGDPTKKRLSFTVTNTVRRNDEDVLDYNLKRISNRSSSSSRSTSHEEICFVEIRRKNREEENQEYFCGVEDILTDRCVKIGEETGNPKLGIGWLCCERMIMCSHVPNGSLSISLNSSEEEEEKKKKKKIIKVKFECDLNHPKVRGENMEKRSCSHDFSDAEDGDSNMKNTRVLIYRCGFLYSGCLMDNLLEFGFDRSNIMVIGTRKELQELVLKVNTGKNNERFEVDICIMGKSGRRYENAMEDFETFVSLSKQNERFFKDTFFIFLTFCFGEHGVVENGIVCLDPIGKDDLGRCIDNYFFRKKCGKIE